MFSRFILGEGKRRRGRLFEYAEEEQHWLPFETSFCRVGGNLGNCNESRHSMSTASCGHQCRVLRYYRLSEVSSVFLRKNSSSIVGLNSFDKVLKAFRLAKKELGEILSSFEMMDKLSLDVSIEAFGLKSPLTSRTDGHEFYVLMETSGSNASHDEEKLTSFVEKALADDIIEDGTLTSDPTKVKVSNCIFYLKFLETIPSCFFTTFLL